MPVSPFREYTTVQRGPVTEHLPGGSFVLGHRRRWCVAVRHDDGGVLVLSGDGGLGAAWFLHVVPTLRGRASILCSRNSIPRHQMFGEHAYLSVPAL